MNHLVLLGDSIFDNAAYVGGGPDVIAQLRERLPHGWNATLKAIDGSVVRDVPAQMRHLPPDATHLVISAGGNDALWQAGILTESARSVAEVLNRLAGIGEQFEREYRQMLQAVQRRGLPVALCTIYYPRFPDPGLQRIAVTALTVFNDCIIRAAIMAGMPLLDLRLICTEASDYANEIEPGVPGGAKIAGTICDVIQHHNFESGRTVVYC
ncbi:MAG: SGNH/GDSL hydrolase family protein [Armatimonadota bacterium]|nr:SGNH/GDSL hydrolase family protein [Armatimonadota bacterium]